MKKRKNLGVIPLSILTAAFFPATILLSCFFTINNLRAQTGPSQPYWQYVRTDSGLWKYSADGCYQPTVYRANEGFVDISVTKCFAPEEKNRVRTRLQFKWTKPPRILYPGRPFEFKISTSLVENSDPAWVISGGMWMRPERVTDEGAFPGWAGGVEATYTKGSPPVVTVDNLRLPVAQQSIAPPAWWATNSNPPTMIRLTYVVGHSHKYWWTYIYRYVDPSQNKAGNTETGNPPTDKPGTKTIAKDWTVTETDMNSGRYWKATWKLKEDGFTFDGHWKEFPLGTEGDLPGFAQILNISGDEITIGRPGYGSYSGTISRDRRSIKGKQSWCSNCKWEASFAAPLPLKFP